MSPLKSFVFNKNATWFYILVSFFLGSIFTYSILNGNSSKIKDNKILDQNQSCIYNFKRIKGYEFIKPLISVEQNCESKSYQVLKSKVSTIVDSLKRIGAVNQASVYFFKKGEWISLNDDQKYHPASLMKVTLLLSILRMAEMNPGLLTTKVVFHKPDSLTFNEQYYVSPTLQEGKSYTFHELLYYMIAYSDNKASWLLSTKIDKSVTKKLFVELGLPEPIEDISKFTLGAREYSLFLKAIYNSVFLSPEYSNYAAAFLSNCTFNEGFVKGFPPKTKLWHKFGEFRHIGMDNELHESGVFFINGHSYLLTVMTRGRDTDKLAGAIRSIARTTYNELSGP